jgi:hypothetical protein
MNFDPCLKAGINVKTNATVIYFPIIDHPKER